MRSQKEIALDNRILEVIRDYGFSNPVAKTAGLLLTDEEVQSIQEYANVVSIKRLGFNDHGPVHMRTTALNGLIMLGLLKKAGIQTTLEKEECGGFDESAVATLLACFLHDLGMSVSRQDHELHSAYLAYPIIERIVREVYPGNISRLAILRSLALEGITGHMGNRTIYSLEAGLVLIADGCDMTKGRARIPMALANAPRVGDIHQYSANAIEEVRLSSGEEKPIRIDAFMSSEVGLFQVEEALMAKISKSSAKGHVELFATVKGEPPKRYL